MNKYFFYIYLSDRSELDLSDVQSEFKISILVESYDENTDEITTLQKNT